MFLTWTFIVVIWLRVRSRLTNNQYASPNATSRKIVLNLSTDYRDTISALEILDTAIPIPFILIQFFFCYDSTPSAFAIKLFIAASIAGLASVFMFSSSERVVTVW
jgi:hypothetical protein